MTTAVPAPPGPPAAPSSLPVAFPPAELDRRFYAHVVDRMLGWTLLALGWWAAWALLLSQGHVLGGVALGLLVGLAVLLGSATLLGLRGLSPGKALLGLRVVRLGSGDAPGMAAGLTRAFVLAVAGLPTFGIGLATLAWTAVTDPGGRRRGWHDQLSECVVVDVRPRPAPPVPAAEVPQPVVNLTALRLVPAPATPAAPTATPATTAPHAVAAVASSAPTAPADAFDPTATRVAAALGAADRRPASPRRATARWRVRFDSGEQLVVDGPVLIGRRPEPRPDEPVGHLVPLVSGDMSLSKTHAQLEVSADGELVVADRGSTNGSVLLRQGVSRPLPPGRPTTLLDGDVVRLGDRRMTVVREP
ncbi:RDD family protein [Nocardioides sp. GCM10027113]|uniref:RDD family protein n=1 Tax=unclassified Nocardioides TaxID=2615069 RepID=UPI00361EFD61